MPIRKRKVKRRVRKGRGAIARRRMRRMDGSSRRVAGIAFVKEPSEFIPDRMFVPLNWKASFVNQLGGTTGATASYLGYDNYVLSAYGFPLGNGGAGIVGAPNNMYGAGEPNLPPFNTPAIISAGGIGDFMRSPTTPSTAATNVDAYHYFTTLSKFYRYVRLWSSTIKVDIQQQNTADPGCLVATLPIGDTDIIGASYDTEAVLQQPFCKYKLYNNQKTANKPLTNTMTVQKLYTMSKTQQKADPACYMNTENGQTGSGAGVSQLKDIWWMIHISNTNAAMSQTVPIPVKQFAGEVSIISKFEFFGKYTDFSDTD